MEKETLAKCYVVYAGPREASERKTIYLYYQFEDMSLNNGKTDPEKLKIWRFNNKLFQTGTVGAIFEAETGDGKTISYIKKATPIGFWKNDKDRTHWRSFETVHNTAKELKSNIQTNTLIEMLQPVKTAYRNMGTENRRLLLAEIIRIITT